jgi:hypothetical protein
MTIGFHASASFLGFILLIFVYDDETHTHTAAATHGGNACLFKSCLFARRYMGTMARRWLNLGIEERER